MKKIIQFGEVVEGYDGPVLNEREIRAAAGILFVMMFVAIMLAGGHNNFVMLKYAIVLFLTDMVIRVFVNPRFAPTLIIGRWIVRNQVPEYVGAKQKKFAWIIGVILGLIMLALQIIANTYGPITGLICLICLVFLFFESAFGICLGCKFYPLFFKEPIHDCPGGVCKPTEKQTIQKLSLTQGLIVIAFIGYIILTVFMFHNNFNQQPKPMFDFEKISQTK